MFIIWISVPNCPGWKSLFRSSGQGDSLFKVILHRNGVQSWDMGEKIQSNFLLPFLPHDPFPLVPSFPLLYLFPMFTNNIDECLSSPQKPTSSSTHLSGWKLVPLPHLMVGGETWRVRLGFALTKDWQMSKNHLLKHCAGGRPKPISPTHRDAKLRTHKLKNNYTEKFFHCCKKFRPTQSSQPGDLIKGLRTPREFETLKASGFDYRTSVGLGKQTSRAQQNLVSTRDQDKAAVSLTRDHFRLVRVSRSLRL